MRDLFVEARLFDCCRGLMGNGPHETHMLGPKMIWIGVIQGQHTQYPVIGQQGHRDGRPGRIRIVGESIPSRIAGGIRNDGCLSVAYHPARQSLCHDFGNRSIPFLGGEVAPQDPRSRCLRSGQHENAAMAGIGGRDGEIQHLGQHPVQVQAGGQVIADGVERLEKLSHLLKLDVEPGILNGPANLHPDVVPQAQVHFLRLRTRWTQEAEYANHAILPCL